MILQPRLKFVCVCQRASGEGYDHALKEGECWMGSGEKKERALGQSFSFVLITRRLPRWSSAGLKLGSSNHPRKGRQSESTEKHPIPHKGGGNKWDLHPIAAGAAEGTAFKKMFPPQGSVEGDPFWDGIRDQLLGEPSNETKACHKPKPILFSTGEVRMHQCVPWKAQRLLIWAGFW